MFYTLQVSDFYLAVITTGAMLDEQPREGETPKMNGSVLVAVAESREEALKFVKEDVYTTQGVWDADKVQIYPVCVEPFNLSFCCSDGATRSWGPTVRKLIPVKFKTAVREPL